MLMRVLRFPCVSHVFMQNPEVVHVDYTPIPYGLSLWKNHLEQLGDFIVRRPCTTRNKTNAFFNSPARQRSHKVWRPHWWPIDGDIIPYQVYLSRLCSSLFVGSPGGDRPDCFRHWEAVILDAIPISNVPMGDFKSLFGEDMVFVRGPGALHSTIARLGTLQEAFALYHHPARARDILLVSTWRQLISVATEKQKGGLIVTSAQPNHTLREAKATEPGPPVKHAEEGAFKTKVRRLTKRMGKERHLV